MTAAQARYLKMLLDHQIMKAPKALKQEEIDCRSKGWVADLSRLPGGELVPWRDLFNEWRAGGRVGKFPVNKVVGVFVTDVGKAALAQSEHNWIAPRPLPSSSVSGG